jgi:L-fucose isomerase-like protein
MKKITFGLIVGTRGFFNSSLAVNGKKELVELMEKLGYDCVVLPNEATPTGVVETIQDARKVAELFSTNRHRINGIIISLPNFGDELGIVNAVEWSKLNVPILVQASDDQIEKGTITERRDSFCGKLSVCNNLYQHDIPFTLTSTHTCKISSPEFAADVHQFAATCRVVGGLTDARIGAIGARPAAFQTVRFSEKLLQKTGITVVPVDLSEILFAAEKIGNDAPELKRKLDEIHAYGRISESIAKENIRKQAKFGLSCEKWITDNEIDAAAFQCWTSIQESYGCAACLSMSMLGDKLLPSACEVDVCGAVSMFALTLASGKASAILDWNNNFGEDRNKCISWHCGNYPKSFVQAPIEISNLQIMGTIVGEDKCFGAVKGKVNEGPFTFFRISTDDTKGRIKSYLGEGEYTNDAVELDGGTAICKIINLQPLMKHLCKNGFEHHVAMVRGNVTDVIEEAVSTYLKWDLYRHQ